MSDQECKNCYTCQKECGQCYTCQTCVESENNLGGAGVKVDIKAGIQDMRTERHRLKAITVGDVQIPEKFFELTLWNTSRCNFRCDYCFVYKLYPNQENKDLKDEVIEKLPEFLEKYFVPNPNIWFFGGEPMYSWDTIVKVYETVKPRIPNANFGMTSNLALITEEKAKWLGARKFGILCSIDGGKESHNTHRKFADGKPTWEYVWKGLENVRKYINQNPQIRWTVAPETVKYLYNDFLFYVKQGLTNLAIEPVYEIEWKQEDLEAWASELEKIGKFLVDSNIPIRVKSFDDLMILFNPQPISQSQWKTRCGLAQGGIGMDINGRVFACHRFVATMKEDLTIGDVFNGIDEEKRKALTEYWAKERPYMVSNSERCETCPFRWGCMGGCLAVNYDVNGDVHKVPKAYCDIMEINTKRLLPYVLVLRQQGKMAGRQTY